jgi:anti-anti-sigma regulatory factor
MSLQVIFDYFNNLPLLKLMGSGDLIAIDKLNHAVDLHFLGKHKQFFMELSLLDSADSMFLSNLLTLHLRFNKNQTPLILLNPGNRVANVFVATGLDNVLHLDELELPAQEIFWAPLREYPSPT